MQPDDGTVLIASSLANMAGTEVSTLMTIRIMREAGLTVEFVGPGGPFSSRLDALDVKQHNVDFYSEGTKRVTSFGDAVRVIRAVRPAVLHSQFARPIPYMWAASKAARHRLPLVWSSRGLPARTYKRIAKPYALAGVHAIGNSRGEAEKLIRHGFKERQVSWAYNPCQFDFPLPPPPEPVPSKASRPVVTTVASLRFNRRIDLFIRMAAELAQEVDVEFVVVGDGPAKEDLKTLAHELGLAERVTFAGQTSDVRPHLLAADVFVSSLLLSEGSGAGLSNAIVEAMWLGVPVCAIDTADIGEIVIEGETGRLVASREPDEAPSMLAQSVRNALENTQESRLLAERAQANVKSVCTQSAYQETLLRAYAAGRK